MPYLRPDGKTQVTFAYQDGQPVRLKTVLISTQHQPGLDTDTLLNPDLQAHVIHPLPPPQLAEDKYELLPNPTAPFERGGPHADTGHTRRQRTVATHRRAGRPR